MKSVHLRRTRSFVAKRCTAQKKSSCQAQANKFGHVASEHSLLVLMLQQSLRVNRNYRNRNSLFLNCYALREKSQPSTPTLCCSCSDTEAVLLGWSSSCGCGADSEDLFILTILLLLLHFKAGAKGRECPSWDLFPPTLC